MSQSIMVTGNFPATNGIGAQARTFWGQYNEEDALFTKCGFKTMTSEIQYEEDVLISGLGLMPKKNEGSPISYDSMSQGYTTTYTQQTYGLGFAVSFEQRKFGKYGEIMAKGMNYLSRSLKQTKEIAAANIFNNAFSTSVTYGDGKELIATDHPTRSGTFSNELAIPADLSEASLEDLLIQINNAVDDRGLRINLEGKKLIVPAALQFQAERIVYSDLRPFTANNDLNAIRQMGMLPEGVIVNKYLGSDTAYFIGTDAPEGLKHYQSLAGEFSNEGSFDTMDHKYKLVSMFTFGATDPRAVYGSAGL